MGDKRIVRYSLAETFDAEKAKGTMEMIDKKIKDAALDMAVEEVKRQEKIFILAMAKKYLQLRKVADKLYDTVKGSNYLDDKVKKALDKYADERNLTVEIEMEGGQTMFIQGKHVVK